jgi:hypothetical protein
MIPSQRRNRYPDLRRFLRIQSPPPHPCDRRLLLQQQEYVPRRPVSGLKKLEAIFQHKMFGVLLAKGKITKERFSTWRHSGFHVFCGNSISPDDETDMETLARYIIRVSFSQKRIQ